jgi:hypothetical protein
MLPALIGCGILSLSSATAWTQEKMKFSFSGKPEFSKFTQTHSIDVGDVPGHQLRVAQHHIKYGAEAPEYAGVKVLEYKNTLSSDYIDGNGKLVVYAVGSMANGDKIYQRQEGLTHTALAADGSRKTSFSIVSTITGGTGKFATMRGVVRSTGFSDMKTATSGSVSEGEYWFEK